jgi:hypothetical protein
MLLLSFLGCGQRGLLSMLSGPELATAVRCSQAGQLLFLDVSAANRVLDVNTESA